MTQTDRIAELETDNAGLCHECQQLRGVIGILASRLSDNYFGVFSSEQIEHALEETNVIHNSDGSVTITPSVEGMGS